MTYYQKHKEERLAYQKRYAQEHREEIAAWREANRLHTVCYDMHQRCFNENREDYKYYGGRDIYVEEQAWFEFIPFRDWALANGYKKGLCLDRINNNDGYYPENCQWLTRSENSRKSIKDRKTRIHNHSYPIINDYFKDKYYWDDNGVLREYIKSAS